jgi:rhodanese-related sulfurtransferase
MSSFTEFVTQNFILFAGLAIIIALIIRMEIKLAFRGFKTITPTEAVLLINKEDAVMLDVREDNERVNGYIKGAKHLALSVLKQRISELQSYAEKPVITYCKMGNRSSQACEILRKHDFKNVMALKGGIEAWRNVNLPIVKK